MNKRTFVVLLTAVLAVVGVLGWQTYQERLNALPPGFASGNGRIESVQVDVTTKESGRVKTILVREGDRVEPGQVLAKMDTVTLDAELARALASVAEQQAKTAESEAAIAKAESHKRLAEIEFNRARALLIRDATSRDDYDIKETLLKSATAAHLGEKAKLVTIQKAVVSAEAEAATIRTRIDDMTLKSTVQGRVLYRLAEEGEVLGNGGKVLTLVNLGDVYMEIYLPAQDAARVKVGADARIVPDVLPGYAARAAVSFVAPEAQFTPKQVETRTERDKLMFRVKLTVPPERILPYLERVKTGIRGVGYVRLDDSAAWPERLEKPFPPPADFLPSPQPASDGAADSSGRGT